MQKLVFGDNHTLGSYNPIFVATQLQKIVPSLKYVDKFDNTSNFFAKSYNINLNSLKLCANYMSPSRINASSSNGHTLMIPIRGNCTTIVENKRFLWGENSFAYLKPKCEGNSISNQSRSLVLIDLDFNKFNSYAKTMLGYKSKESFFNFENPKLIPLKYNGISFDIIFKQLFKIVDLHIDSIENLEKTRFDEVIYRTIVMMFLAKKIFTEDKKLLNRNKTSTSCIKLINELKNEDFFAFMSLTDLENFLDLSTRNLQLLFKKNFNMTPTQFLREQKLKHAKKLITESNGNVNITQIATEVGFLNFSQFSKYYKDYHGILPSHNKNLFRKSLQN